MIRILLIAFVLGSAALFSASGHSQEPDKKPEPIPAPKIQIESTPLPSYEIVPYLPRTGSRDVWQHYGVNAYGRFVPKVIVTPFGPVYSRDGQPYPWMQNRPTAIMPYVRD